MMLGIQILSILVALIMCYYGFIQFKKKKVDLNEILVWGSIWAIFIILTLFPHLLDFMTTGLNLERKIDIFIFGGFVVVVAALFKNYLTLKEMKIKLNNVVTKIAIQDYEKGTKKRK